MVDKSTFDYWNYRIAQYAAGDYGIHEVFYRDGKPVAITEEPISFVGDDPDEIFRSMEKALDDARNKPVLDYDEIVNVEKNDTGI